MVGTTDVDPASPDNRANGEAVPPCAFVAT